MGSVLRRLVGDFGTFSVWATEWLAGNSRFGVLYFGGLLALNEIAHSLVVIEELLGLIQECYSILDNHKLHAPQHGQCPYDSLSKGFWLSVNVLKELVDALEVRLFESEDARPKKRPKLGVQKVSKNTTAREAVVREAHDNKEDLDDDESGAWSSRGKECVVLTRADSITG
ncbi:hypothetical protein BHE74_00003290 [Ensete ventricosum]|nr:hypothetical protein GW17_00010514 [Ensete ventricosum]RWW87876.1 hypothetical protein BHE74_00003290 [Ensete ventricosum]RZR80651.1 hypothetical protein BHM03_00006706 [Ensete ventricosum]